MHDTTTMRAVVSDGSGGPKALQIAQVPKPTPLPTEILVRVHAAGVNPVDWKTRDGHGTPSKLAGSVKVLGWDVSGVVEDIGYGVTRFAPGDEVYGMPWFPRPAGAYGDYVAAPSRQFANKPARLTHEQAAAIPLAALTAWQALVDTADVRSGQRVLVHAAAGGVGHLAVQFAKQLGAYVLGTARPERHEWLRSIGVDEPIDYTTVMPERAAQDADVVLDLVGGDLTARSLPALRPGGCLIAALGGVTEPLQQAAVARGVRAHNLLVEPDGAALAQIARLLDEGAVRVEVAEVFDLVDVQQAHALSETGRTRGKIVLRTGA